MPENWEHLFNWSNPAVKNHFLWTECCPVNANLQGDKKIEEISDTCRKQNKVCHVFTERTVTSPWAASELSYWITVCVSHPNTDTAEGTSSSWLPVYVSVFQSTLIHLWPLKSGASRGHTVGSEPQNYAHGKRHTHTETQKHTRHFSCLVLHHHDGTR